MITRVKVARIDPQVVQLPFFFHGAFTELTVTALGAAQRHGVTRLEKQKESDRA